MTFTRRVALPTEEGGGDANVIAWIWARTIRSPDPSWNGHVPLSPFLGAPPSRRGSNKPVMWVEPVVDRVNHRTVSYRLRKGGQPPTGYPCPSRGYVCCYWDTNTERRHQARRTSGQAAVPSSLAVVAEGRRGRAYLEPRLFRFRTLIARKTCLREGCQPTPQYMGPPLYGMTTTDSLFTDRQLVALSTFSDLLRQVRGFVERDARGAGLVDDGVPAPGWWVRVWQRMRMLWSPI